MAEFDPPHEADASLIKDPSFDSMMRIVAHQHAYRQFDALIPIAHARIAQHIPERPSGVDLPIASRICGCLFAPGDIIYRCRECGMDDTCVMCAKCFKSTGGIHDSHDVSVSITSEGGGCCDCGDEEAWTSPTGCAIHGECPEDDELDPSIDIAPLTKSFAEVLDWCLDVFEHSPQKIAIDSAKTISSTPSRQEALRRKEALADTSSSATADPSADSADDQFAAILWNDETHSFAEVIHQVCRAIRCPSDRARLIAEEVNEFGRAIITYSKSPALLVEICEKISDIGLHLSIGREKDIWEEEEAGRLLILLDDMVTNATQIDSSTEEEEELAAWSTPLYRAALRAALLSPRRPGAPPRLDTFLLYDVRLWKVARTSLRSIYVSVLLNDPTSKKEIVHAFARNYRALVWDLFPLDRSPEISILHFSVQLFTVPSLAESLVHEPDGLVDLLLHLIVQNYAQASDLSSGIPFPTPRGGRRLAMTNPAFLSRRCTQMTHDLRFLLNSEGARSAVMSPPNDQGPRWRAIANVALVFQGMDPQTRTVGDHVLFESESWIQAFHITLSFAQVVCQLGRCLGPARIGRLSGLLGAWVMEGSEDRGSRPPASQRTADAPLPPFPLPGLGSNADSTDVDVEGEGDAEDDMAVNVDSDEDVSSEGAMANSIAPTTASTISDAAPPSPAVKAAADDPSWDLCLDLHSLSIPCATKEDSARSITIRDIIDFSVLQSKTSLHLPLHWMLGECLAQAASCTPTLGAPIPSPAALRDALISHCPVEGGEEVFLRALFDYPLRTWAWMSQVSVGMWVRNGVCVRSQAHHYREINLREYTQCVDLHLIQAYLSVISDPDAWLLALIDRHDLYSWYVHEGDDDIDREEEATTGTEEVKAEVKSSHGEVEGETSPEGLSLRGVDAVNPTSGNTTAAPPNPLGYSQSQTSQMIEELLYLIILSIKERPRLAGWSGDQILERSLIHATVLPATHTEVLRRIPESISGVRNVEEVLRRVAEPRTDRASLMDGALKWRLKDAFLGAVDPYWINYNRNTRFEVMEECRRRNLTRSAQGQDQGEDKGKGPKWDAGEDSALPSLIPIPPTSPFHGQGEKAFSGVGMVRLIGRAWMVGGTMREMSLHLLLLGLRLEKEGDTESVVDTAQGFARRVYTQLVGPTALYHRIRSWLYREIKSAEGRERKRTKREGETEAERQREDEGRAGVLRDEARLALSTIDDLLSLSEGWEVWVERVEEEVKRAAEVVQASLSLRKNVKEGEEKEEETVEQKRKREGKERRARVQAEMAASQAAFAANNAQYLDDSEGEEGEDEDGEYGGQGGESMEMDVDGEWVVKERGKPFPKTWEYSKGKCISCQEKMEVGVKGPEGKVESFALIGFLQSTTHLRTSCLEDSAYVQRLLSSRAESWTDGEVLEGKALPQGTGAIDPPPCSPPSQRRYGMSWTTCGHLIHHRCYAQYVESVRSRHNLSPTRQHPEDLDVGEFLCPFCKALGNTLIPIGGRPSQGQERVNLSPVDGVMSDAHATREVLPAEEYARVREVADGTRDHWQAGGLDLAAAVNVTQELESADLLEHALMSSVAIEEVALRGRRGEGLLDPSHGILPAAAATSASTSASDSPLPQTEVEIGGGEGEEGQVSGPSSGAGTGLSRTKLIFLRAAAEMTATWAACQPLASSAGRQSVARELAIGGEEPDGEEDGTTPLSDAKLGMSGAVRPALLEESPFGLLVNWSLWGWPGGEVTGPLAIHPYILRLWVMEATRVILSLAAIADTLEEEHVPWVGLESGRAGRVGGMGRLVERLIHWCGGRLRNLDRVVTALSTEGAERLVWMHTMVFLRRTALYLSVRYGMDLSALSGAAEAGEDGTGRLLRLFSLPASFDEAFPEVYRAGEEVVVGSLSRSLHSLCSAHLGSEGGMEGVPFQAYTVRFGLPDPGPLGLVRLPHRLDTLFEWARQPCRACGKIPNEPSLCLVCGLLLCSQSHCCDQDGVGECTRHCGGCSGDVGVFLQVNRCTLLLLHGSVGTMTAAPYVTNHGELDPGFRRGKPMFFSDKHYDDLHTFWVDRKIPQKIANRIEQQHDVGGWETF